MWWNIKTENIGHFYIVKVPPYFIFKLIFKLQFIDRIYQLIFFKGIVM